jgi:hypothetical protein
MSENDGMGFTSTIVLNIKTQCKKIMEKSLKANS